MFGLFRISSILTAILFVANACTLGHETGSVPIIEYKVQRSIGLKFSESEWSKPTNARAEEIYNDGKHKEYAYTWLNGCSIGISVNVDMDEIVTWRYLSNPQICKNIKGYTFGT